MTEQEWMTSTHPQALLDFLQRSVSDRKLRLFACACSEPVLHLMADERSRKAVRVAEAYADGLATDEARRLAEEQADAVRSSAQAAYDGEVNESTYADSDEVIAAGWTLLTTVDAAAAGRATVLSSAAAAAGEASKAASDAEEWTVQAAHWSAGDGSGRAGEFTLSERSRQAELARCVFGNPFRPVSLEVSWRTPAVVALARTIYDERRFEDMAILADALEEAGCLNRELLRHLRPQGQVHVRGCWCLDLLLGKQ